MSFDEISTAPPAVQAALLRVVLERTVGDLRLPDAVSLVAAANTPEQAAGGWELSPPLANRFLSPELACRRAHRHRRLLGRLTDRRPAELPVNWLRRLPVTGSASLVAGRPRRW